jgi:hypothetical protein
MTTAPIIITGDSAIREYQMAAFDALPRSLRDAANYGPFPIDPAWLLSVVAKWGVVGTLALLEGAVADRLSMLEAERKIAALRVDLDQEAMSRTRFGGRERLSGRKT